MHDGVPVGSHESDGRRGCKTMTKTNGSTQMSVSLLRERGSFLCMLGMVGFVVEKLHTFSESFGVNKKSRMFSVSVELKLLKLPDLLHGQNNEATIYFYLYRNAF